jgi:hypothetical protein
VTFEDMFKQTAPGTTCEPCFENNTAPFEFPVYDYHSKVYIDLFDEFTSNLIGDCDVSIFSIVERQTQKQMRQLGGFKTTFLQSDDKKVTILETLKSLNTNDDYEWVDLHDARGEVVGKIMVNARFDENNLKQCFSTRPPEDDTLSTEFTLEGLRHASTRISKLIKLKNDFMEQHQKVLQFERYRVSFGWLFGSITVCLNFDAEYLPMCGASERRAGNRERSERKAELAAAAHQLPTPTGAYRRQKLPSLALALLACSVRSPLTFCSRRYMSGFFLAVFLYNLKCRIDGSSIIHLLHDQEANTLSRQIGKLRVAVVGCEGLNANSRIFGNASRIDPLVRCFYVPQDEDELKKEQQEREAAKVEAKKEEMRDKKHAIPIQEQARNRMNTVLGRRPSHVWSHR